MQNVIALQEEMQAAGAWVFGGGLHPANTATVLRHQGGEIVTTDGPFIESKEQIGGITDPACAGSRRGARLGAQARARHDHARSKCGRSSRGIEIRH